MALRPVSSASSFFRRGLHVHIPSVYPTRPPTSLAESYIHVASDIPYLSTTLGRLINYQAETIGDRVGFVVPFQNIRKTYAQFSQDATDLANGLLTMGLRPRDRLGIWSPNSYEWMVTMFAASKAGLILVNVNPAYTPLELEFCINKVQIKAIIAATGVGQLNYYDHFQRIAPEIHKSPPGRLRTKRVPSLESVIMVTDTPQQFPGTYSFSSVIEMRRRENDALVEKCTEELQSDDAFNIQFTSGTTGTPKGATLSSFGMMNVAYFTGHRLGVGLKTNALAAMLPLFHIFGCNGNLVQAAIFGAKMVLPSPRFDPEAVFKAIQDEKCQSICGVPTMYKDMVHHPNRSKYDLSSLKCGIMGGSPCPPELVKMVHEELGIKEFCCGYGSTEMSMATYCGFLSDSAETLTTTTGYPLSHVEAKIVGRDGKTVPVGEKGELWTRSSGTMLGYWGDEEKTKETILPDRWMNSGDLGRMNKEGYLTIVGRSKDMVIRGGENVYPVELENVFYEHPHVLEAHVHGVPDERMGEEMCAWIRLRKHTSVVEEQDKLQEELKKFCQSRVAKYKTPRYFIFYESPTDIPMTQSGKIKKYELAKLAVKRLGLQKNDVE